MATKGKRLRVLNEAYAELPPVACKGLCWAACSAVPVYPVELDNLEAAAGRKLPMCLDELPDGAQVLGGADLSCPLLVMKRCSVHAVRPLACRAFGAVDGLPCPHGCTSTHPMSNARFDVIRGRVAKL